MTGSIHAAERALIIEAFRACYGQDPTLPQAQCLQAVDWLETNYGKGWSASIPGAATSRNRGAITAGAEWTGATFEHRDSYPDDAGVNHWYTTKFRAYDSDPEAVTDLCNIVYLTRPAHVLDAATHGSMLSFSEGLYNSGYYRGFGATPDERIAHHHAAVQGAIALQCKALGEPPPYPIAQAELDRLAAWAETYQHARFLSESWLGEFHPQETAAENLRDEHPTETTKP